MNSVLLLLLFSSLWSCKTVRQTATPIKIPEVSGHIDPPQTVVITNPAKLAFSRGADNFDNYAALLDGKRVGILTNQSGVLADQTHLVDFLLSENIIVDGRDVRSGLPIISLYGDNKKPKPEQLAGIDIMVFDLQDVGARFYTYISSLHYVMEACAQNSIPLVVLDRPNPTGSIVDGPVLEPEFTSFVGMHPIPVLHGMTIGEYAQMINGEKWLKNGIQCDLHVIACTGYNRDMPYSLPVKPSPNLPNDQAINLYASLCFFEGTNVSVGRGTDLQFQIYGSPDLPDTGFCFTPKPNPGAKTPPHNGVDCYGEDLSQIPMVTRLELKWLIRAYRDTTDKNKFFTSYFTLLAGTRKLQAQIEAGLSAADIRATWEPDLISFRDMQRQYLIY
jgi:uncharacterized protein YbbC (DUF1343 family)